MSEERSQADEYKDRIFEMINEVENLEYLEYLYRFSKRLKENWGV